MSAKIRYSAGDKIVHPKHGAGVVSEVMSRHIDGRDEEYYVFKMPVGSMTMLIPTEAADALGVRRVIPKEDADELLSYISGAAAEREQNWNRRQQRNTAAVKSGELRSVADVIVSLTARENERGLSTGERKLLRSAEIVVTSEIALSKDLPYAQAEAAVNEALERNGTLKK